MGSIINPYQAPSAHCEDKTTEVIPAEDKPDLWLQRYSRLLFGLPVPLMCFVVAIVMSFNHAGQSILQLLYSMIILVSLFSLSIIFGFFIGNSVKRYVVISEYLFLVRRGFAIGLAWGGFNSVFWCLLNSGWTTGFRLENMQNVPNPVMLALSEHYKLLLVWPVPLAISLILIFRILSNMRQNRPTDQDSE